MKKSTNDLFYHRNSNMEYYRTAVYGTIVSAMQRGGAMTRRKQEKKYNKQKFAKFSNTVEHLQLKKEETNPSTDDTMTYLARLVDNYWEESSSLCHLENCNKPTGDVVVLCEPCNHWFHLNCVGLTKYPRVFPCEKCRFSHF